MRCGSGGGKGGGIGLYQYWEIANLPWVGREVEKSDC